MPGAREVSETALTGFKIAFPVVSTDGERTAFSGVGTGHKLVYLAADDAVCLNDSGHPVPNRLCKCGFYCFHSRQAAHDLTSAPENSGAVVVEVAASGRYRRHELGLRYARQRVRHVWLGRCRCGWAAEVFADGMAGRAGWRALVPCCRRCGQDRPVMTATMFATLSGEHGLTVSVDDSPLRNFEHPRQGRPGDPGRDDNGDGQPSARGRVGDRVGSGQVDVAAVVDAELAVLHARIDALQAGLDRVLHQE